jgi:ABC-2 type transport system permease protein
VYASEGMRGALVPHVPHMPAGATIGALLVINCALLALGVRKFNRKAVS